MNRIWKSSLYSIFLCSLLGLPTFSSCFLEDAILADKQMEYQAVQYLRRTSFINQSGTFTDVFVITKEDIFNLFEEDIPDDAEITDLYLSVIAGTAYLDQPSNQTTAIDATLRFNGGDVFISQGVPVVREGFSSTNLDAEEFFAGKDYGQTLAYLSGFLEGTNDEPMLLNMVVTPRNPSVPDPYTSLEIQWSLLIKIKYKACTTVLEGTDADDCEKI